MFALPQEQITFNNTSGVIISQWARVYNITTCHAQTPLIWGGTYTITLNLATAVPGAEILLAYDANSFARVWVNTSPAETPGFPIFPGDFVRILRTSTGIAITTKTKGNALSYAGAFWNNSVAESYTIPSTIATAFYPADFSLPSSITDVSNFTWPSRLRLQRYGDILFSDYPFIQNNGNRIAFVAFDLFKNVAHAWISHSGITPGTPHENRRMVLADDRGFSIHSGTKWILEPGPNGRVRFSYLASSGGYVNENVIRDFSEYAYSAYPGGLVLTKHDEIILFGIGANNTIIPKHILAVPTPDRIATTADGVSCVARLSADCYAALPKLAQIDNASPPTLTVRLLVFNDVPQTSQLRYKIYSISGAFVDNAESTNKIVTNIRWFAYPGCLVGVVEYDRVVLVNGSPQNSKWIMTMCVYYKQLVPRDPDSFVFEIKDVRDLYVGYGENNWRQSIEFHSVRQEPSSELHIRWRTHTNGDRLQTIRNNYATYSIWHPAQWYERMPYGGRYLAMRGPSGIWVSTFAELLDANTRTYRIYASLNSDGQNTYSTHQYYNDFPDIPGPP